MSKNPSESEIKKTSSQKSAGFNFLGLFKKNQISTKDAVENIEISGPTDFKVEVRGLNQAGNISGYEEFMKAVEEDAKKTKDPEAFSKLVEEKLQKMKEEQLRQKLDEEEKKKELKHKQKHHKSDNATDDSSVVTASSAAFDNKDVITSPTYSVNTSTSVNSGLLGERNSATATNTVENSHFDNSAGERSSATAETSANAVVEI